MQLYESGEMYLETILILSRRMENVRSIDIVKEMGFSKPSVSNAMKNLREGGYISVSGEGYITFTDEGERIAQKIFERHVVLTECFLRLGVSEEVAADDACRIEHIISDETFNAIKTHLEKNR
ncbi:MAG: metal-dependent transcriptional regulator [Lachnospiraceae bacterium]|nr:metal-dependent transcriptional regulator [Lachnospiraceae bacterium]